MCHVPNLAEFTLRVSEVCMVCWFGCGLYKCSPHSYLPIFHLYLATLHPRCHSPWWGGQKAVTHFSAKSGRLAKAADSKSFPVERAWEGVVSWNFLLVPLISPGPGGILLNAGIGKLRYVGVFNESCCPAFFSVNSFQGSPL